MKRVLLTILIMAMGAMVFYGLRSAVVETWQESARQTIAWQTQAEQFVQLQFEHRTLTEHFGETKQLLAGQAPLPALTQLMEKVFSGAALTNLSAAESEQLLAELGFNWNTTGDYVIVSKQSLDRINFDGLKGVKLTTAAIATLAITPAEQDAIEAVTGQLGKVRAAWAKEHVQRTEPSGKVVAQYTLPEDSTLSQSLAAIFTNGIFSTLGEQRARWLQDHSLSWMRDSGIVTGPEITEMPAEYQGLLPNPDYQSQPTVLTLERYPGEVGWRGSFTLMQAGSTMNTIASPWQPFPEAFRAVFPGGWEELAAREGFELPKSFKKK